MCEYEKLSESFYEEREKRERNSSKPAFFRMISEEKMQKGNI